MNQAPAAHWLAGVGATSKEGASLVIVAACHKTRHVSDAVSTYAPIAPDLVVACTERLAVWQEKWERCHLLHIKRLLTSLKPALWGVQLAGGPSNREKK
jgi:hypothetical protein